MLIDSHVHMKPNSESLVALLASMEQLGIHRSIAVGGGLVSPNQLSQNIGLSVQARKFLLFDHAKFLELCNLSDSKLIPFYFANPWVDTEEYEQIGSGFFGLKLGPAVHGCALTSPETRRYLQVATKFKHPIYLHCLNQEGFRVSSLVELARQFPNLVFILGHGGIGNLDFSAVDEIESLKTIYFETSGTFKAVVAYAIQKLGIERILFGSEYPLQSVIAELAKIRDLGLEDSDFSAITSKNISQVLQRRLT